MTELGNRLKEARESKGLSLDDLQEITKIQKRYLSGIEEGDYTMMPGKFYVRAFIKQYCEAVGLDSEEVFEEYKSNVPTTNRDEIPEKLSRVKTRKNLSSGKSKFLDMLPRTLGGIIVVGIVALIYVIVSNAMGDSKDTSQVNQKSSEQVGFNESKSFSEKATQDQKSKATPKTENKQSTNEKVASKQKVTLLNTVGNSSTYELKNTDAFTLKLVSTGNAWIGVTNSTGTYLFQGTLKANETKELDLKNETNVVINIGSVPNTQLYVNDEKLKYLTNLTTQKVTIQFTKAK